MDNHLIQHVNEPTRESNILDLVLTSNNCEVEKMNMEDYLGNNDNNVLSWNLIHTLKIKKGKKDQLVVSQRELCWDEEVV